MQSRRAKISAFEKELEMMQDQMQELRRRIEGEKKRSKLWDKVDKTVKECVKVVDTQMTETERMANRRIFVEDLESAFNDPHIRQLNTVTQYHKVHGLSETLICEKTVVEGIYVEVGWNDRKKKCCQVLLLSNDEEVYQLDGTTVGLSPIQYK